MDIGDLLTRASIWLALGAYTLGEASRVNPHAGRRTFGAHAIWSAGCVLYVVHVFAAFQVYHGWSHAAAYAHTAARTAAVVGLDWGGGIWVNYAFTVLWLGEAGWSWINPESYRARPRGVELAVRATFLFMIVNAAVVFVSGPTRWIGLAIIVALVWIWRAAPRWGDGGAGC